MSSCVGVVAVGVAVAIAVIVCDLDVTDAVLGSRRFCRC